jgi:hypothetical protein
MRKIVISALIAGAAVVATPASAQNWGNGTPAAQRQIRAEIEQLSQRISQAEARRAISHREAQALRRQSIQVQRNFHAFSRNGIDRREYAVLNNALQQIRQNLRVERRDNDRRRG